MHEELARIDPTTGRVDKERSLSAGFLSATAAHNSLFVTTQTPTNSAITENLLRLDPRTLAETGHWQVSGAGFGGEGLMALAGGGLWVAGGDRLARFSFSKGRITTSITLSAASSSSVTTNSAGTVLVVTKANQQALGQIERRDPVTGQILSVSAPIGGAGTPSVEGVVGNDLWVSEATGMMGYVELYDLGDLAPLGAVCNEGVSNSDCIEGTNAIRAQLADGLLWVTQTGGGASSNFCGKPDGQVLASLPVPDDDVVLAIGQQDGVIFVGAPQLSPDKGETLTEEQLPTGCR